MLDQDRAVFPQSRTASACAQRARRWHQGLRALGWLLRPLAPLWLRYRLHKGDKEDPARIGERLGNSTLPRPAGTLLWFHAVSVGETASILALLEAFSAQGYQILLTTGTLGGAQFAQARLPANARHQFLPLDFPAMAASFLEHWRPDLAILCESELWPNLLLAAHQRKIPVGLINARLSPGSFGLWHRWLPGLARAMLAPAQFCLTQTPEDAERFAALGAPARSIGNLKYCADPLSVDPEKHAPLRTAIGTRKVVVAASTHAGEDEKIIEACYALWPDFPDLLLIIVPRHPERAPQIAAHITTRRLRYTRRSTPALPDANAQIYLADTLGELGLLYAVSDLALIGGTFMPIGGHNPIEAAKLGVAFVHGPHIHKNRTVFEDFNTAKATKTLNDTAQITATLAELLRDPARRAAMAAKANTVIGQHQHAHKAALEIIGQVLATTTRPLPHKVIA